MGPSYPHGPALKASSPSRNPRRPWPRWGACGKGPRPAGPQDWGGGRLRDSGRGEKRGAFLYPGAPFKQTEEHLCVSAYDCKHFTGSAQMSVPEPVERANPEDAGRSVLRTVSLRRKPSEKPSDSRMSSNVGQESRPLRWLFGTRTLQVNAFTFGSLSVPFAAVPNTSCPTSPRAGWSSVPC